MEETLLTLKIVTPSETVFEGFVEHVMAPGALGYFGILKNHAGFVTSLRKGDFKFRETSGRTRSLKVAGGFLEVFKNRVLVLTEQVQGVIA